MAYTILYTGESTYSISLNEGNVKLLNTDGSVLMNTDGSALLNKEQ